MINIIKLLKKTEEREREPFKGRFNELQTMESFQ